ncbi:MAG: Integrase family protein [Verrucomicrobiales bacterium]|nr:Integrase family protein [Verrucomicrobiales bacterium]
MKQRFRLYKRKNGYFYCHDSVTAKQESLDTRDKTDARRLVHSRNEALVQPAINLTIGRAYCAAADPKMVTRTWQTVMDEIVKSQTASTLTRWLTAIKDKAFVSIADRPLLETRAEHFLDVLNAGKVSTNVYLRRLHNFALDMNWLPWPILPKKRWPKIVYKDKRGIKIEEHLSIIEREPNQERRNFYSVLWYTGWSQSDVANMCAEAIHWKDKTMSVERMKLKGKGLTPPIVSIGPEFEKLLRLLPQSGPLFPYLKTVAAKHRTTEFRQRCIGLKIEGVCLHSYRYAWAERARTAGMPERYAQEMLGHRSKAVHSAYSKSAVMRIHSLEEYENGTAHNVVRPDFRETPPVIESAGQCLIASV